MECPVETPEREDPVQYDVDLGEKIAPPPLDDFDLPDDEPTTKVSQRPVNNPERKPERKKIAAPKKKLKQSVSKNGKPGAQSNPRRRYHKYAPRRYFGSYYNNRRRYQSRRYQMPQTRKVHPQQQSQQQQPQQQPVVRRYTYKLL